ncbi:14-3-3 domain-containing protein [Bisporella sp. PMI_857]|nr:14-3-3 domain-containing protein [Bisporella sp. PMI_857]
MASFDVDLKFLGRYASNMDDVPFLASQLYQILGNLTMLSPYVLKARKLRRLDTTRHTKSVDLYCRIIWYAKIGLSILDQHIIPVMAKYTELKVLTYKLRASYYHLYVLYHNKPVVSLKPGVEVHTPPGLKSPHNKPEKGKGVDRGSPSDPFRPGSVQPTHPLEGGPVGGEQVPVEFAPDFLIPAEDYRPAAFAAFQEACAIADKNLWGSHPLRLSAKVEMCAFLYDCLHEQDSSRLLAKKTIADVYNAQEGMDDDMFEDAAELVGTLGRMMKRGLGGSTPGNSEKSKPTPPAGTMPGMVNPI